MFHKLNKSCVSIRFHQIGYIFNYIKEVFNIIKYLALLLINVYHITIYVIIQISDNIFGNFNSNFQLMMISKY